VGPGCQWVINFFNRSLGPTCKRLGLILGISSAPRSSPPFPSRRAQGRRLLPAPMISSHKSPSSSRLPSPSPSPSRDPYPTTVPSARPSNYKGNGPASSKVQKVNWFDLLLFQSISFVEILTRWTFHMNLGSNGQKFRVEDELRICIAYFLSNSACNLFFYRSNHMLRQLTTLNYTPELRF